MKNSGFLLGLALICFAVAALMAFFYGVAFIMSLMAEHPLGFFVSILVIGFIAFQFSRD